MAKARRKQQPTEVDRAGYEGAEIFVRERTVPGTTQKQTMAIRAKRGTFEWRYGQAAPGSLEDALYLAGCEFGRLWERAGLDGPGTVDWAKEGSSQWKGLPDGRVVALDDVKVASQELGMLVTARLTLYCAEGLTVEEVAKRHNMQDRDARAVLASDLKAAAVHFRFLGA